MANRFWVGGTGTWDASDTTHWSLTSNGAGGQTPPGAADSVTFDALSGGGTVTVNTNFTILQFQWGAFTGAIDFSVNNNSPTFAGTATAWSGTGTGFRSMKMGSGTFFLSSTGAATWDMSTVTNLTWDAGTSTIVFSATVPTAGNTFNGGGLAYNNLTFAATNKGFNSTITGNNSFNTLTVPGGARNLLFASSSTNTIATLNVTGSSANPVRIGSSMATGVVASLAATNVNVTWAALQMLNFTVGTPAATSSFDLGGNAGIAITAPSGGGTAGYSAARAYLGVN